MIRQQGSAVRITVCAQPRASRTEVIGPHGDAIRIRIAAPPVEGAANRELLQFVARTVGVARSAVRLAGGGSGRNKIIEIDDVAAEDVRRALLG
jgi:uncharacterized protein (TIGR00251 family)